MSESVDRTAVREMVEDFWRSFILFMRDMKSKYPAAGSAPLLHQLQRFVCLIGEKGKVSNGH